MNRDLTRLSLASFTGWYVAVKLALVSPVVPTRPAEAGQDVLTLVAQLSRWLDAVARYERGEIGPVLPRWRNGHPVSCARFHDSSTTSIDSAMSTGS